MLVLPVSAWEGTCSESIGARYLNSSFKRNLWKFFWLLNLSIRIYSIKHLMRWMCFGWPWFPTGSISDSSLPNRLHWVNCKALRALKSTMHLYDSHYESHGTIHRAFSFVLQANFLVIHWFETRNLVENLGGSTRILSTRYHPLDSHLSAAHKSNHRNLTIEV